MKDKLALFDFDGTLFDTQPLIYFSYQQALKEAQYSFEVTIEEFNDKANGKTYKDWLPIFLKGIQTEEMIKIRDSKNKIFQQHLEKIKPNDSLFSLIEAIKPFYHIGLMTTSTRENVEAVLNLFSKYELFDYILTREDVEKEKPNPECYLKGMAYFNILPENTIIFEDSLTGLEAARKSGANVYVVDTFK